MSSDEGYIERNKHRYRVVRTANRASICECYTQQGTWYKTSYSFCLNTVKHGYFDAAVADRGSEQGRMTSERPPSPPEPPQQGQQPAQPGTTVTRVTYEKGRFLW